MARAARKPSIPRVRTALVAAREHGDAFPDAWSYALATVRPSAEMRVLLAETQDARQRAYDGQPPTRSERAAGELVEALDAEPVAA